jgi:YihY family inner membrane protein
MSTATTVPETHTQSGDDARDQLRATGTTRVLRDAAARFKAADGTSFARALGHSTVLTLIPSVIALIGAVMVFDLENFRKVLADAATSFAPGPAGRILTVALERAEPSSAGVALAVGIIGLLLSGTVGMTHLERAANRIYGVDEDRTARRRNGLAFLLAATVGVMLMAGLAVIVAGGAVGDPASGARPSGGGGGATDVWEVARWPIGVALVAVAMTIIFMVVPNRRQPRFSWLLSGTAVAVASWLVATVLLGFAYEHASILGGAYGPLVGMIALLVWGYATGLAVLFGLAFAAQLEAFRAGEPGPERSVETRSHRR